MMQSHDEIAADRSAQQISLTAGPFCRPWSLKAEWWSDRLTRCTGGGGGGGGGLQSGRLVLITNTNYYFSLIPIQTNLPGRRSPDPFTVNTTYHACNPLTAGPEYIRFFIVSSPHQLPHFEQF